MQAEGKTFTQVMDVFGFRIIVGTVADCYHALGVVHAVYKPLDGRFRDFIAIPKANGYQSLHTVLFGPYGSPIEVQIRTAEMDLIRSEEHPSELQSLMRISYAVFCLQK